MQSNFDRLVLNVGLVSVLAIGAAGCASADSTAKDAAAPPDATGDVSVVDAATVPDAQSDAVAPTGPGIKAMVSPSTMAAGDTVAVTVTVTNFVLTPPSGTNVSGQGHYHIYLDGASGGNYLAADQVPSKQVKIPSATKSGAHTLRINLSENDHTPLQPAVEDIVNITVK